MKFLNFILLIVLMALVIFSAQNWQAITTPVPLTLLFTETTAPLGLILLAVTGLLTLLFLTFVIYMQSSTLMTRKRLNREVEEQRKLANNAEASRLTELRTYLETELKQLLAQNIDTHQKVETRLAEVELTLREAMEETGTSLSAYIGELGDKLERE